MPAPATNAGRRAREQADDYSGVFAPTKLDLDDGDFIKVPPHPNLRMLDDDAQEAYEELLFEIETYDRSPDVYIPEQNLSNGVTLPAQTRRGEPLIPYRIEGKLVKPPYSIRVVQIALGAAAFAKLKAGGKNASDVWRIWNDQSVRITDRGDVDPKSNGSASAVAELPG